MGRAPKQIIAIPLIVGQLAKVRKVEDAQTAETLFTLFLLITAFSRILSLLLNTGIY
jgi:hypothetical protein